jgi:hypothetical protein
MISRASRLRSNTDRLPQANHNMNVNSRNGSFGRILRTANGKPFIFIFRREKERTKKAACMSMASWFLRARFKKKHCETRSFLSQNNMLKVILLEDFDSSSFLREVCSTNPRDTEWYFDLYTCSISGGRISGRKSPLVPIRVFSAVRR